MLKTTRVSESYTKALLRAKYACIDSSAITFQDRLFIRSHSTKHTDGAALAVKLSCDGGNDHTYGYGEKYNCNGRKQHNLPLISSLPFAVVFKIIKDGISLITPGDGIELSFQCFLFFQRNVTLQVHLHIHQTLHREAHIFKALFRGDDVSIRHYTRN